MSTYLKSSFDSENYDVNRPTYPPSLYEAVMSYHDLGTKLVVDVGCGTGIATYPLLVYFEKVIGCDPSARMLIPAEEGHKKLPKKDQGRVEFKSVAAENLSDIFAENSVDMIVGAESIHWVKHALFFEEAYKILRPHGTLAYWFYVEPVFLDYPRANKIFQSFVYEDERYFAPYWPLEMQHVRNFGRSIIIPKDKFKNIESEIFEPLITKGNTAFRMIRNDYTIENLRSLLRTWSIYHSWRENNKESGNDICDMLVEKLQNACGWNSDSKLRVEWGTSFYLARKREIQKV